MIAATLAALFTGIRYYRRHRQLRVFLWYTLFSLVEDAADYYRQWSYNAHLPKMISGGVANAFMLFEFLTCIYFIRMHVSSVLRRRVIMIDAVIYLAFVLYCFIRARQTLYTPIFFFFESLFLIVPCLVYFYELFLDINLLPLKNQPAFWIITGILFLNCFEIPLLLTEGELGIYHEVAFSLNFVLYILFFSLLIRAYICQPAETPSSAGGQIKTG